MRALLNIGFGLALALFWGSVAWAQDTGTSQELDLFWAEVARTVSEGDFESYRNTYHPDAIVVSGVSDTSQPIAQAMLGWESGFTQTREGKNTVSLEFRFIRRINDASTAHETGMFRYSSSAEVGQTHVVYMNFEALLIKQDGWKTLMEYQTSMASAEDWDAAK